MDVGTWRNNLPSYLTSFVGRERERDQALAALSGTRLLVLTGAGGSGKTRLALELATASASTFPDGAWWVELAPLTAAGEVAAALAGVLGVRPLPGRTQTQAATQRLAEDRALVVLDNCEHLLDAAADLGEAILRACPRTAVLATSRIPLRIPGESDWQVPPLSLPRTDSPEEIAHSDACQLFAVRAAKARPSFAPGDDDAATMAHICRELDGLPLAIELAAARARMLSLGQIADGLNDRFKLLRGGPRATMARQQALRASMDWSYELLSEQERLLLTRLSVFAGGWSLEGVEAVCPGGDLDREAILDVLGSLVDESLVVVEHQGRNARYRLLETVRQYAAELLDASGGTAAVKERHLDFFAAVAERAGREVNSPRIHDSIDLLETEHPNLQAAVDQATATRPDDALRMAVALTPWWRVAGHFDVGRRVLSGALGAADPSPSPLRARAVWSSGYLALYAGDPSAASECVQQALGMAAAVGDDWTQVVGLCLVAGVRVFGDPRGTAAEVEKLLPVARRLDEPWPLLMSLVMLGRARLHSDDYDGAQAALDEAALLADRVGAEAVTNTAFGLGSCVLAGGDFERCRELCTAGAAAARDLGDPITLALVERTMSQLELLQGRAEAARARMQESLDWAIAKGGFLIVPTTRVALAAAHAALGDLGQARQLLELVLAGGAGALWQHCETLVALGEVLWALGDTDASLARGGEALEVAGQVGVPSLAAAARELLGRLAIGRREWNAAEQLLHDALAERLDIGLTVSLPQTLDVLAEVEAGCGSLTDAARLLGAADRGRQDLGSVRSTLHEPAVAALEGSLTAELGADAFASARSEGAAMPIPEAVAWIRRGRGARKRPTQGWESLTPTELRVVELVALGLTNPQIAERMFISAGTAKVHLGHIYQKLDVRSRSELAALAARRDR